MSATWADIQRLASDFQRIQLAAGSKKLSENNCVEVVSMLIASKAVDIVFTTDGRQYVTRKHLLTEIKNECVGRGGRVSLSELARALSVDYEHIENAVSLILKQSSAFMLCNAELISKDYVDKLCNELNERLMDAGMISVSQIAKTWDLPNEILSGLVLVGVGSKIDALRDGDVLYTRTYLSSQRNIIRALLCGLTKVTPVSKLQSQLELTSAMFWMLFDELEAAKEVPGKIVGGRTSSHCLYHPNIHSVLVRQFILKTFLRDEMLELTVFKKLSVSEPKTFMKDLLKDTKHLELIYLPSAVISRKVWDEIETTVKMEKHLPEIAQSEADIERVIGFLMKSNKEWLSISGRSFIYSQQLLSSALKALDGLINTRAEELISGWGKQQKASKKEEKKQDDDWAVTKIKKSKGGKGKGARQAATEETVSEILIKFPEEELVKELHRMSDIPKQLVVDVAEQIRTRAEILLKSRMETLLHSVRAISAQDQKRAHVQLQEKLRLLYDNICIFEEGAATIEDSVATNLRTYLLRTLCTNFANSVLSYISRTENVDTLAPKARDEVIASIESLEAQLAVEKLFMALSTKDLDSFHDAVFGVCSSSVCSLNLKMPDKKQREDLIKVYEEELVRQLRDCTDPAAGLLLALLILIARNEKIAVHASGKFVSHLISKVDSYPDTSEELSELLSSAQKLVIASMQSKGDETLKAKSDEKLVAIKAVINGFEYVEKLTNDED